MRVAVTGGAGFLGSHLCEKLLAQGNEVICVDNFFTGAKRNISHLVKNSSFELLRHDVTNSLSLEVDQIFNLACPASPVHYQRNPVQTIRTSVQGAITSLEIGLKSKAKVFQASTSEIYGDPAVHPQPEQYWGNVNPIGVRACYDEGKRCAETLFFDYRRQFGVNVKVARIFNTYGPRMSPNDGRVVSNFVTQALRGENLTIYGDGLQTRSFCYVDDLIDGIIEFMSTSDEITGPINLGNPSEITMLQLAETILRLTQSKRSKIMFLKLPEDDPTQRRPDISVAQQIFGWSPKVDLETGLEKTIAYFRTISSGA